MKDRWQQTLIMLSGLLLIIFGLGAIVIQIGAEQLHPPPSVPSQQINVSANQLTATTRFVGLELVVVGALLQIVGFLGAKPWEKPS